MNSSKNALFFIVPSFSGKYAFLQISGDFVTVFEKLFFVAQVVLEIHSIWEKRMVEKQGDVFLCYLL